MHSFAIREMENDGLGCRSNVGCKRVGHQEVAYGTGVEDGPSFDGVGIGAELFLIGQKLQRHGCWWGPNKEA
jgi:hypothetical protein